ncbi:MAG: PhoH family protein [Candidatus Brocadia sp. AMX2]|nr:MAG: PhoH family protein [Candidatus Brocadia sp. AMX2]MBC6932348.1 PhoH family protein [Candidatus Brocadia sp.]MBL1169836.1 PhoH family protein [Candidatus Brocadia sp. AMX1]NOG40280.1 PhoH family protein [Planctomycetota bacterium]NUO04016.1 PhoH family protein [Candidatus Brocadia sinica]
MYGSHDRHLRLIRDAFHVQLVARHGLLKLEGEKEQVDASKEVLNRLLEIVRSTGRLDLEDVEQAIVDAKNVSGEDSSQTIDVFQRGIFIKPKTDGQAKYIEAIKKNDLVFCIGPAGTGKTYLAVALALSFLKSGRIRRIVLARPAVEAGEKLGYLPGDIKAKVNPYLRPLYDAIADMMDVGHVKKYLETDLIEILPLAYMRGRTLNDSFIILDEAQNCTVKQMKTFLTRLGVKSKVVVTGDITQVDLPAGEMSGLIDVQERLMNINNVSFVYLTKADIVRHKLVQDIVDAYES